MLCTTGWISSWRTFLHSIDVSLVFPRGTLFDAHLLAAGVLVATIGYYKASKASEVDVEFHVARAHTNLTDAGGSRGAQVEHMLIRVNTYDPETPDRSWPSDLTAGMDDHMAQLPALKTVTMETIMADECATLTDRLVSMHASGRLRRRTCEEAQKIAQAVERGDRAYLEVVSPLWYSSNHAKSREVWYVDVSWFVMA